MRVLVLDILLNQSSNNSIIPPDVLPRLYKEFNELARREKDGYNALLEYLTQGNDGKAMAGVTGSVKIMKFDLTKGDRILYTYGKYLPYLHHEKDSLVLLGYAKHDDQAYFAKHTDFSKEHNYFYLKNIVKSLKDIGYEENAQMSEEDKYEIANILMAEGFKGYCFEDEELAQFSAKDIEKHVMLSPEQQAVINRYKANNAPTLILGGAGTGKTMIAVHILKNIEEYGKKTIYFTQSRALLEKVKKQYLQIRTQENIDKNVPEAEFWDINYYCLNIIGRKDVRVVRTKQFMEQFLGDYIIQTDAGRELIERAEKNGITKDCLWTEIRGTIKGGMQNWTRVVPMNQDDKRLKGSIKELEILGYIKRLESNKRLFVLKDSIQHVQERRINDTEISEEGNENLKRICDYFSTFNASLKAIDEDYYLSLNDEYSLLSKEQRAIVLEVYKKYDNYLMEMGLLDENDLVRMAIETNRHLEIQRDFVFVDEVQDYTELQLYYIHLLAKKKNGIIYAGDVHQIINPTLFSVPKLKELHREGNSLKQLRIEFLNTNFRCQKGVIDVANRISELRRLAIGSQMLEIEQEEKSNVSLCLYDPYRLEYSQENIKEMMQELEKYPQIAILVPDSDTKKRLEEMTSDIERPEFIFTVDEIKGMEYDCVICFNLVSYYLNQWKKIILHEISGERTQYRYYFNVLYVAITRARMMLGFIDDMIIPEMEGVLKLKKEASFDVDLLHLSDLDTSLDAWLERALELKEQGQYVKALQFFAWAKAENTSDMFDCYIGIAEEEYDFINATKYCIANYVLTGHDVYKDRMRRNVDLIDKECVLKELVSVLLEKSISIANIIDKIEAEFDGFTRDIIALVYEKLIEIMELNVLERLEKNRVPKMMEEC